MVTEKERRRKVSYDLRNLLRKYSAKSSAVILPIIEKNITTRRHLYV